MIAKEYLMQVNKIDKDIDLKLEQLDSLYALATKATTVLSDMPKSCAGGESRMENTIVKIVDLENEINDEIDHLVDLKKQICDMIRSWQYLLAKAMGSEVLSASDNLVEELEGAKPETKADFMFLTIFGKRKAPSIPQKEMSSITGS